MRYQALNSRPSYFVCLAASALMALVACGGSSESAPKAAGPKQAATVAKAKVSEGPSAETEHLLQGRTEGQAPEVDGRVWINDGQAATGEFVPVEISEAHPFDLVGRSLA